MIPFTNCLPGIPGPSVSCPHLHLQVVSASPHIFNLCSTQTKVPAIVCHTLLSAFTFASAQKTLPHHPAPTAISPPHERWSLLRSGALWEPDSLASFPPCVSPALSVHMLFPLLARSLVGTGAVSYSSQCSQHPAQGT